MVIHVMNDFIKKKKKKERSGEGMTLSNTLNRDCISFWTINVSLNGESRKAEISVTDIAVWFIID